jgi:cytoskeletal protein CcmA (bactofilin family)
MQQPTAGRIAIVAAATLLTTLVAVQGSAQVSAEPPRKDGAREMIVGPDRMATAFQLRIELPVNGDLIAAGGSVEIDAPIAGDAVLAGGDVRLGAAVGQSVYAAGARLTVVDSIGRNARIAGGLVEFGPRSRILGNVTVGGGNVRLRGVVDGTVQAAGGRLLVDGPVGGDVIATAGRLELGPGARISGRLRIVGDQEIARDPAAEVLGGVERTAVASDGVAPAERSAPAGRRAGWLWTFGLMLLAAVMVRAFPIVSLRVSDAARSRPALCALVGFAVLVCVPVAALLLLVTVIGIPLSLLTIAIYLAALLISYVAAGVALGDRLLALTRYETPGRSWWRVGAAMMAVLLIALLARIPLLGWLVVLAAFLIGLGALAMQLRPRNIVQRT